MPRRGRGRASRAAAGVYGRANGRGRGGYPIDAADRARRGETRTAVPTWPPIWRHGLRAVFVGFNPSPRSWDAGHHYAHPGNRFWRLLADAGLTPVRLSPEEDGRLPEWGLGCTDVVGRPSPSAADLRPTELRAGGAAVRAELARWGPRVAAYTGKGVYRAVAGLPDGRPVAYGEQAGPVVPGVIDFVLPSPSGRSGLRYETKRGWYEALAELLRALGAPEAGR